MGLFKNTATSGDKSGGIPHLEELCQHQLRSTHLPSVLQGASVSLASHHWHMKLWENSTKQCAKLWSDILCFWMKKRKEGGWVGVIREGHLLGFSFSYVYRYLVKPQWLVPGALILSSAIPGLWHSNWKHQTPKHTQAGEHESESWAPYQPHWPERSPPSSSTSPCLSAKWAPRCWPQSAMTITKGKSWKTAGSQEGRSSEQQRWYSW